MSWGTHNSGNTIVEVVMSNEVSFILLWGKCKLAKNLQCINSLVPWNTLAMNPLANLHQNPKRKKFSYFVNV